MGITGDKLGDVKLGDTYVDEITGYEGVAIGRAEYMTGCLQAALTCRRTDGGVETAWFDYPRLKKVTRPGRSVDADRRRGGPTPSIGQSVPRP